jgi:transposase
VKTDARDALLLARLLRNDDLTPVRVPTVTQEAARDLVRGREDVRGDLMRARHRVTKLLLRQGELYCGGAAWTGKHLGWLRRQRFASPATQAAFDADLEAVEFAMARRGRLDAAIAAMAAMAADSEFTDLTHRLGCLRGISTLTGFALAVEIGDWHRFTGNSIPDLAPVTTVDEQREEQPAETSVSRRQARQHSTSDTREHSSRTHRPAVTNPRISA